MTGRHRTRSVKPVSLHYPEASSSEPVLRVVMSCCVDLKQRFSGCSKGNWARIKSTRAPPWCVRVVWPREPLQMLGQERFAFRCLKIPFSRCHLASLPSWFW